MRIDHVAIAVEDVEEAAARYAKALGAGGAEFETVPGEGVRVAIIRLENGRIELMQPTGPDSPISRFLERKGEGLHHVALQTGDIEGEVARMEEGGTRFIGGIRGGSEGTRVAFVHPKSLNGVLAELCSPPAAEGGAAAPPS